MKIELWIVALGILGSCSWFSPQARRDAVITETSQGELVLRASLDKSAYRPGEAVIVEVQVVNTTDEAIQLVQLSAASLSFWSGPEGEAERFERYPVMSSQEEAVLTRQGPAPLSLGPGENHSRKFMLTRTTGEPGRCVLQVHMAPFADLQSRRIGKLYSNPVVYDVGGDPLFERDNAGLVVMADAIKMAAARVRGEVFRTEALLIEDAEVGFYVWWVNLDHRRADEGKAYRLSYLVDPYSGRIRDRVKPFTEEMKPQEVKPRLIRAPKRGDQDGEEE